MALKRPYTRIPVSLVTDQVKRSFPGEFTLVPFGELLVADYSGIKASAGIICPRVSVIPTNSILSRLQGLGCPWSSRMDDTSLEDVARQLSDLEVALFLSLAAHEHCLIETTGNSVHDLGRELALVLHFAKKKHHETGD
jgi:hypothetical protein